MNPVPSHSAVYSPNSTDAKNDYISSDLNLSEMIIKNSSYSTVNVAAKVVPTKMIQLSSFGIENSCISSMFSIKRPIVPAVFTARSNFCAILPKTRQCSPKTSTVLEIPKAARHSRRPNTQESKVNRLKSFQSPAEDIGLTKTVVATRKCRKIQKRAAKKDVSIAKVQKKILPKCKYALATVVPSIFSEKNTRVSQNEFQESETELWTNVMEDENEGLNCISGKEVCDRGGETKIDFEIEEYKKKKSTLSVQNVHITSSTSSGMNKYVSDVKLSKTSKHSNTQKVTRLQLTSPCNTEYNATPIHTVIVNTGLKANLQRNDMDNAYPVIRIKTGTSSSDSLISSEEPLKLDKTECATHTKSIKDVSNCVPEPTHSIYDIDRHSSMSLKENMITSTTMKRAIATCGIEQDEPLHSSILQGTGKIKDTSAHHFRNDLLHPSSSISKQLVNELDIKLHREKITVKSNRSLLCQVCGRLFKSGSSLRSHLLTHSSDKPHECPTCGKHFRRRGVLLTHLRTHTNDRPFVCSQCKAAFSTSGNLKRHLVVHEGDKDNECKECGKKFHTKTGLNSHSKIHRVICCVCEECGKNFKSVNSLKVHKLWHSHSKELPYKCKTCNKSYIFYSVLKRHMEGHTGKEKHQCHLCSAKFVWKSGLNSHLQSHFPKKFNCSQCPASFNTDIKLKTHLKKHSNPRPHSCTLCLKKFAYNYLMVKHIKTVHGRKNFITVKSKKKLCRKQVSTNEEASGSGSASLHNNTQTKNDRDGSVLNVVDESSIDCIKRLKFHLTENASGDYQPGENKNMEFTSNSVKDSENSTCDKIVNCEFNSTVDWNTDDAVGLSLESQVNLSSCATDGNDGAAVERVCSGAIVEDMSTVTNINVGRGESVRTPPPSYPSSPRTSVHVPQSQHCSRNQHQGVGFQITSGITSNVPGQSEAHTATAACEYHGFYSPLYGSFQAKTATPTGPCAAAHHPSLLHATNDPFLPASSVHCFSSPHSPYCSPQPRHILQGHQHSPRCSCHAVYDDLSSGLEQCSPQGSFAGSGNSNTGLTSTVTSFSAYHSMESPRPPSYHRHHISRPYSTCSEVFNSASPSILDNSNQLDIGTSDYLPGV